MNAIIAEITKTPLDAVLVPLLRTAGIVLVLWAIIKSVKDFASGQVSKGVQRIIIMSVLAAFLFSPTLISTLIDGVSAGVKAVVENISKFFGAEST